MACPLDWFALGSEAKAEHVWGEPEPILRLSMTILDEPGSDDLPHRRCLSFDQVSNSGSPSCNSDVCKILTNTGKLFWGERNEDHGFSLLACRAVGISKCWQVYWKPQNVSTNPPHGFANMVMAPAWSGHGLHGLSGSAFPSGSLVWSCMSMADANVQCRQCSMSNLNARCECEC